MFNSWAESRRQLARLPMGDAGDAVLMLRAVPVTSLALLVAFAPPLRAQEVNRDLIDAVDEFAGARGLPATECRAHHGAEEHGPDQSSHSHQSNTPRTLTGIRHLFRSGS